MLENMIPTKLPVIAIVKEAFQGAFFHFNDMVRIVWLPTLLYLMINVYISHQTSGALEPSIFLIVAFIASTFLWAMMAVAWHRRILTGETPTDLIYFKFGRREARFVLVTIMLTILFLPGISFLVMSMGLTAQDFQNMMAGGEPTINPENVSGSFLLLGYVLLFLASYFSIRLSLLLPAVAIGENVNAGQILNMSKGNFWRLLGAVLLCGLVVVIALNLISALVASLMVAMGVDSEGIKSVITIVASLLSIFALVVNVAVLSISYRHLSQDMGARA